MKAVLAFLFCHLGLITGLPLGALQPQPQPSTGLVESAALASVGPVNTWILVAEPDFSKSILESIIAGNTEGGAAVSSTSYKIDALATSVNSTAPKLSGKDVLEITNTPPRSFAYKRIVFFGHGLKVGSVGKYIARTGGDAPRTMSDVTGVLPVEALAAFIGGLNNADLKSVFLASCETGLGTVTKPSLAKKLAIATGKNVFAPKKTLAGTKAREGIKNFIREGNLSPPRDNSHWKTFCSTGQVKKFQRNATNASAADVTELY